MADTTAAYTLQTRHTSGDGGGEGRGGGEKGPARNKRDVNLKCVHQRAVRTNIRFATRTDVTNQNARYVKLLEAFLMMRIMAVMTIPPG